MGLNVEFIVALGALLAAVVVLAVALARSQRAQHAQARLYLEHIARLERMLLAENAVDAASAERIMATVPPLPSRKPDQFDEMWAEPPRARRGE